MTKSLTPSSFEPKSKASVYNGSTHNFLEKDSILNFRRSHENFQSFGKTQKSKPKLVRRNSRFTKKNDHLSTKFIKIRRKNKIDAAMQYDHLTREDKIKECIQNMDYLMRNTDIEALTTSSFYARKIPSSNVSRQATEKSFKKRSKSRKRRRSRLSKKSKKSRKKSFVVTAEDTINTLKLDRDGPREINIINRFDTDKWTSNKPFYKPVAPVRLIDSESEQSVSDLDEFQNTKLGKMLQKYEKKYKK